MKHILLLENVLDELCISREDFSPLLEGTKFSGYEAIWYDHPQLEHLRDKVEILVTAEHEVGADVLNSWPNLRMISLAFTGYDKVHKELSSRLKLYYVPDYSSDSVAELTVGLTLSVLRKIPRADQKIRQGRWHWDGVRPGIELHGKTVGILGTGNIGIKSAKLFQAFGCTVIGWARTRRQSFLDIGGKYADSLNTIFAEADIVILHLPVDRGDKGTQRIVGSDQLKLMRPTAVLINTARGELVDTDALTTALKENRILGAGLDVFDEEPAPGTLALMALENVVLTPHIGFKTREALGRLAKIIIENIERFLAGSSENLLP